MSHLQLTCRPDVYTKMPVPGRKKKVFWVHLSYVPPPVALGRVQGLTDDQDPGRGQVGGSRGRGLLWLMGSQALGGEAPSAVLLGS